MGGGGNSTNGSMPEFTAKVKELTKVPKISHAKELRVQTAVAEARAGFRPFSGTPVRRRAGTAASALGMKSALEAALGGGDVKLDPGLKAPPGFIKV